MFRSQINKIERITKQINKQSTNTDEISNPQSSRLINETETIKFQIQIPECASYVKNRSVNKNSGEVWQQGDRQPVDRGGAATRAEA